MAGKQHPPLEGSEHEEQLYLISARPPRAEPSQDGEAMVTVLPSQYPPPSLLLQVSVHEPLAVGDEVAAVLEPRDEDDDRVPLCVVREHLDESTRARLEVAIRRAKARYQIDARGALSLMVRTFMAFGHALLLNRPRWGQIPKSGGASAFGGALEDTETLERIIDPRTTPAFSLRLLLNGWEAAEDLDHECTEVPPPERPEEWTGALIRMPKAAEILMCRNRKGDESADALRKTIDRAKPGDPYYELRQKGPARGQQGYLREDAVRWVAACAGRHAQSQKGAIEARAVEAGRRASARTDPLAAERRGAQHLDTRDMKPLSKLSERDAESAPGAKLGQTRTNSDN